MVDRMEWWRQRRFGKTRFIREASAIEDACARRSQFPIQPSRPVHDGNMMECRMDKYATNNIIAWILYFKTYKKIEIRSEKRSFLPWSFPISLNFF